MPSKPRLVQNITSLKCSQFSISDPFSTIPILLPVHGFVQLFELQSPVLILATVLFKTYPLRHTKTESTGGKIS